ncbi:MAG: acetyltransferase [Paenibacillus sp.]|nr:acetyltransferase [Paenibacillus sp.]
MTLNTWPPLETVLRKGWIVRYADGYTKRANSVSPLYGTDLVNADEMEELIRVCESYYRQRGLDTVFKLTPYVIPDHLDRLLDEKGYGVVDESSVRLLRLDNVPKPAMAAKRQEALDDEWLFDMARLNRLSDKNMKITREMLDRSTLRKGFFTLYDEDTPVACGLGVIQDEYVGLYDIVTDAAFRRRGYGEQLVLNILEWGKSVGARYSFLQVVQHNEAAVHLYAKLGYKEIYKYWYRVKPDRT